MAIPGKVTIEGKRYVLIAEEEYRLLRRARARGRVTMVRRPDGKMEAAVDAMPFMAESIGRKIRSLRKRVGMGQLQLATKAGVRPETISRIERGQGNPTSRTIEKLVRAMGLDPEKD